MKKLNIIAMTASMLAFVLGLVLCLLSTNEPIWFPTGFLVSVASLFLFFLAWDIKEKSKRINYIEKGKR